MRLFLAVAACLSPPSPLHHWKWAHLLVFDGSCLFSTSTTPLPSKTSKRAHFRWWLLVCHLHHPFTIENERICSFLMVAACFPPSPHLCHRKRENVLVFDDGCLFVTSITPLPSKMSASARFQCCYHPLPLFTIKNECRCLFSRCIK